MPKNQLLLLFCAAKAISRPSRPNLASLHGAASLLRHHIPRSGNNLVILTIKMTVCRSRDLVVWPVGRPDGAVGLLTLQRALTGRVLGAGDLLLSSRAIEKVQRSHRACSYPSPHLRRRSRQPHRHGESCDLAGFVAEVADRSRLLSLSCYPHRREAHCQLLLSCGRS